MDAWARGSPDRQTRDPRRDGHERAGKKSQPLIDVSHDCHLELSLPACPLHKSQKNIQLFPKQGPLILAEPISLRGKDWKWENRGTDSVQHEKGRMTVSTSQTGAGVSRAQMVCPELPSKLLRRGLDSDGSPTAPRLPPHLLVPTLAMLFHLCLEDGSLALGAEGQEQQAVGLVEGQVGGGHASFAAGARGKKKRLISWYKTWSHISYPSCCVKIFQGLKH